MSENRRRIKAAQLHGALHRAANLTDRQAWGEDVDGIDGLADTLADIDELKADLAALGGDPDDVATKVAKTRAERLEAVRRATGETR